MASGCLGRRVAVTGGAQGIGRSIAEALAVRGARVAIGDIQEHVATATAGAIGRGTLAYPLDVRDPEGFARFLNRAESALGGLDALVNNAGILPLGPFLAEPDVLTRRTLDIDLGGVWTGTKLAGRRFAARGSGHVVNIASVLGTVASPGAATYCAAKHAVVGLGHALRQEWRGSGVRISTVCPAFVSTELLAGMSVPAAMDRLLKVGPEAVAEAVVAVLRTDRSRTVYVPAIAGVVSWAGLLLPTSVSDWLFRVSGGDRVTRNVDRAKRAAYQARAEGRDGPAPA